MNNNFDMKTKWSWKQKKKDQMPSDDIITTCQFVTESLWHSVCHRIFMAQIWILKDMYPTLSGPNQYFFGLQVKPFCGSRCQSDYKLHLRLCAMCQKDLATAPDSFSAPVGSGGTFKEFCTKECMTKFEEMLQADVEVIRVEAWKRSSNTCSVCQKVRIFCACSECVSHILCV